MVHVYDRGEIRQKVGEGMVLRNACRRFLFLKLEAAGACVLIAAMRLLFHNHLKKRTPAFTLSLA